MTMDSLQLTVIIPTLQRPDTLYWTIRTVIEQDYSNFSILVSDNYSKDSTEEVVRSFNDDRIKYVNPGGRLSMSRHWEFALSHVSEGFVTILGDDDGLMPGALAKAASLIQRHKVEAIGWRFCNFNWPGLPPYFMIPMSDYYREVSAPTEIQRLFQENVTATIQFPSLYGGFISAKLIDRLRTAFGGEFFHSRIPDFYSAAVIAGSVEKYLRLEFPLSLNATSKHSTGYATINPDTSQKAIDDLGRNQDNIPMHPDLIFMKSINLAIADALLHTNRLIPTFPRVDFKRLLPEILKETRMYNNRDRIEEIIGGVREIGNRNGLGEWTEELIKGFTVRYDPPVVRVIEKYSPVSQNLYLHTDPAKIKNVYDAALLAGSLVPRQYYQYNGAVRPQLNNVFQYAKYTLRKKILKDRVYVGG